MLHTYSWTPLWTCGRKDSYTLHTLQLPILADLTAPNAVAIAVADAFAVSSGSIQDCQTQDRPTYIQYTSAGSRQFVLDASPRRSLPCFLASCDTAPVPLDLTPLIPTTAGRQFVPRNRRDEPTNRTRARHSDKVSTAGRRDFLVPAQPKPAGAAYQRVCRTLPPRAKPEYIGNPSPSESDPAAQSTLPTRLLPLLYMPYSTFSAFYFYSPLAWPCLFPVTSFEKEEATSNWQSSHPNPILTSLLHSQALSNACHSFKSPFVSFLARTRATASLLHRRCSSPTGLVLSAPPIVRQTRTRRASIPVTQRSFTAAQPVTKPACRMGSAFTERAPSQ